MLHKQCFFAEGVELAVYTAKNSTWLQICMIREVTLSMWILVDTENNDCSPCFRMFHSVLWFNVWFSQGQPYTQTKKKQLGVRCYPGGKRKDTPENSPIRTWSISGALIKSTQWFTFFKHIHSQHTCACRKASSSHENKCWDKTKGPLWNPK